LRKERNRWKIILDLLKVIKDEKKAKKTRIMNKAYLDWNNFNRYLDFLLDENYIMRNLEESNVYEITDNGIYLLEKLKDVEAILEKKEKTLNPNFTYILREPQEF